MLSRFLNPTSALWALRMLLQFGGFWLVTNGYATHDDIARALSVAQDLIAPAGGVAFLIGLAANIWATFRDKAVANGQSVGIKSIEEKIGPVAAQQVKDIAQAVVEDKPTLWEQWTKRRN